MISTYLRPYSYLKKASFFVCSSRSEGFSTVITEALILGKTIVTTDCSGMHELLGESEYGLITKNNTEALQKGIIEIIENKELQSHYQVKSPERGKTFQLKNIIRQIESIL